MVSPLQRPFCAAYHRPTPVKQDFTPEDSRKSESFMGGRRQSRRRSSASANGGRASRAMGDAAGAAASSSEESPEIAQTPPREEGPSRASGANGGETGGSPRRSHGRGGGAGDGEGSFGRVNWVLSIAGVVLLAYGFILLSQANVQGDNLPAPLAPFLILGSYLMIFVAIVVRGAGPRKGGPGDGGKQ